MTRCWLFCQLGSACKDYRDHRPAATTNVPAFLKPDVQLLAELPSCVDGFWASTLEQDHSYKPEAGTAYMADLVTRSSDT